MKKWPAVTYDVSHKLAEVPLKRLKVPQGIKLELIIELEDEAFNKLYHDPVWGHRMQEAANLKALAAIEALKKSLAGADAKAAAFNEKTGVIFTNDFNAFIKQRMETAGKEMAVEVDHLFENYKKGQKELTKFRIKSGSKITVNAVVIVGSVAVAGASHGALAPASIVAIARGGIVIAQECAKLALTADQAAVIIKGEIIALKAIFDEDMSKATKAGKIKQGAKEAGLGVLSGLLGVEIPNLKNCKAHIEVHKIDIAKLDGESHKLGKTVNDAMDAEEHWVAKFNDAKKTLPADKVGKIRLKQEAAEKTLHHILEATYKVNDAINRANERQELFEKTIDAMTKGLPEWIGYFQTVTTLAVDIGLAVGGASSGIEKALGAVIAAEVDIGSELLDRV